ncbi:uncharacterized protein LOC110746105 [Prunus avium]|uniref:Uncharacterized protein LOC110746105 n=1 Tax=Prunus avium TaxID=42229 RepID=A0A6P5RJG4_PRUAV|nr:uncharacterized protein LOC110746105 [Prunus avium]
MGRSRNRKQKQQNLVNLDWTELPRGILEIIFERLTVTDCVSVSDVCKAWRHVVAQELAGWQSRGVPWLMCEKDREENSGVLKYLVESCGELLLVCRLYNTKAEAILETHDFKVYSLDFSLMSWKRVHDLGDKILFLGKCCSRSVSSTELGVAMRNRIYFSNDHAAPWWNEWDSDHLYGISARLNLNNAGRKDWGVFSLGNGIHEDFCFRGNRDRWGAIWLTCPQWWCCRKLAVNRYSN